MNATMSHLMKRTILSLMIAAGLLVLGAAETSAHEVEYRPYYAPAHYAYARTRSSPGWLKRNREFQRWNFHNQYRFKRHVSRIRIDDAYRFENRHRWHGRRVYGAAHHYQGYRRNVPLPINHRH